jgi:hypothetical protein
MTNADLQQKRLIAAAIDAGIGIGLTAGVFFLGLVGSFVSHWLGGLLRFAGFAAIVGYVLLRDVLGGDRSIGKKIQGIRVVNTFGGAITLIDSVKRNVLFAVGSALWVVWSLFQMIPILGCIAGCIGWPLMLLANVATIAVVVIEVVKILQDGEGIRLGDQIANTRVAS